MEGRELGSGRDHRYRFEVRDQPPAERARHAHRPAPTDQAQRVHRRARPDEIQNVVRALGPDRVHARRQRPAVVDEYVVDAGRGQRVDLVLPPSRGRDLDAVAGRDRRGRHPHRRGPAADQQPPRPPGTTPNASSEPCAVRYVSGSAARTSHGNVVVTGISSEFGNNAYSA